MVKVNNLCPADGNPLCSQPKGQFDVFFLVFEGCGFMGMRADTWG